MEYNTDVSIDDDEIKDYVRETFDIDDVFKENDIKAYISRQFMPEDVFDEATLTIWAIDHGYVKGYSCQIVGYG